MTNGPIQIFVWKEVTFDAAHHLEGYKGPCSRVHGHTYKVQLGVLAPIHKDTGIAIDMVEIAQFLNEHVVSVYDHQDLNEVMEKQPTAEMLAMEITEKALKHFKEPIRIRIYETPTSWVDFEGRIEWAQKPRLIIPKTMGKNIN